MQILHFHEFAKASRDGMLLLDTESKIIALNKAACMMFDQCEEALVQTSLVEHVCDTAKNLFSTPSPFVVEQSITFDLKASKETLRVSVEASFGALQEGISLVVMRDVTERKYHELEQMQYQIHVETEHNLFLDGPVTVFRWRNEAGWPVDFVSENVKVLLGLDAHTLKETCFRDVMHPEDHLRITKLMEKHLAEESQNIILTYRVIARDGSLKWVYENSRFLRDASGDVSHIFGYLIDITREKQIEAEQKTQEQLLVQQSRMAVMGEMIDAIAHQWKQPLSVLSLHAQNLPSMHQFNELNEEGIGNLSRKMMDQVMYMSRTIEDFRTFFEPSCKIHDFRAYDALKEVLRLVESQLYHHNIDVIIEGDKGLSVRGYPNEFKQVFINLLMNAKDAIVKTDRREGKIQIVIEPYENLVQVRVYDDGLGIEPKMLPDKLFNAYTTSKSGGGGIGLYLCKTILESHMHGKIRAFNHEGGACLEVMVPEGGRLQGLTLLVGAPMSEETRYQKQFQSFGSVVVLGITENILKSIYTAPEQFDVLIMDLTCPGMIEATEVMRLIRHRAPRIKMAAVGDRKYKEYCESFVDGFFESDATQAKQLERWLLEVGITS